MHLSIIIVNYNVKYFLEQCLYSVKKACRSIEAEIFVVDNNSADGSREYLEPKFPGVIFKWNEVNVGFAKANNSVIKDAKGAVILFLNPDTILPEDCFDKCLGFINSSEKCGALAVRMIDGSGHFLRESKRSFPSPLVSFFKMAGFAKAFPSSKLFSKYYAGHLPENGINVVDVLPGAFFMVKKTVLDRTGSFDENFFMYGEDIDLSYRIQQAGFKNYYFPEITIIHFKGESTQRESRLYIRRFYGAMQLFVNKHYRKKKAILFAMHLSIGTGKVLSFLKLYSKRIARKSYQVRGPETLIIANQQSFNEIIQLIKHAPDPLIILGRIEVKNNDPYNTLGTLEDLQKIIIKNNASKLIFCEGELSFKEIFHHTERLKDKIDFLFHADESESVVGSNSKNEQGVFMSKFNHRV